MNCEVRNSRGTVCGWPAHWQLVIDYGRGEEVIYVCSSHVEEQRRLFRRFIKSQSVLTADERREEAPCLGE
jgi:hypothetical protein